MDHGDSVSNMPSVVDLGDLSGVISSPQGVDIISDGTNWYGFVSLNGSSDIVRLSFGSDLTNTTPSTDVLSGITELVNINPVRALRVVDDGGFL